MMSESSDTPITTAEAQALTARTVLERNYLFQDLPTETIDSIAALASRRSFGKNKIIFSQGDPGDALYGVASGRVRISACGPDGREVFLNIMEPGDAFGEIAVVDGRPRTAGAVAIEPTTLIVIRRADFLAALERSPDLAMHLLQLFCQRLRWTSDLVEESAFLVGPARLAKRLLVLAALHGTGTVCLQGLYSAAAGTDRSRRFQPIFLRYRRRRGDAHRYWN